MRPSDQVRELATSPVGVSTDELLHDLLCHLTSLLSARRAYVTEILSPTTARTIAAWEDGRRSSTRQYKISGTPCAAVMRDGAQVVDCNLARHFPENRAGLGPGSESFVGSPILDRHGATIGQLCVFGDKPLEDPEMAGALIALAAVRGSAELEHRKQQDSLLRERQKLEVLLGNLPGMAYRCDDKRARTVQFVSQGCEALTGYSSDELTADGFGWSRLIHPDDETHVWRAVENAARNGRSFEVQYRIRTKDGEQKWVWERGCGIREQETGVLDGFVSDASALKESQAALARSEAYSSAIVATAAEGIITLDAQGKIESFNRAAEQMFGYSAGELIGEDVHVLMPEPYRSGHTSYIDNYLQTGEAKVIGRGREVVASRKDGSTFPIYLAASEIVIDGERCFAGIIRDISEQKAAEQSLRAIERRFRAVFDQRHQLTGILSIDGIVLEANQNSLDFAGIMRDAVLGRNYWDTPWWSHSSALQARVQDAIDEAAGGNTVRFEASSQRADGTLATLEFSIRPITDSAGNVVFLVPESHDITDQRRAEEEARHHRERIAHVSRLSTLGEMAAGIAHEINQPLTAISLFAQAGRRLVDAGDYTKLGEVCDKLGEHALRASAVIDRMQSMARQRTSARESADCNALIDASIKLAEAEARIHDIEIESDFDEGLPAVRVDAVQVQQVALNLLRNGMEAMISDRASAGRAITVRTQFHDDRFIEVAVADSGCGVPDEFSDKLFTPFSTTKKAGMGMGLSISQAIVAAHAGQIGFCNNETGGATFWFTLPIAEKETRHV